MITKTFTYLVIYLKKLSWIVQGFSIRITNLNTIKLVLPIQNTTTIYFIANHRFFIGLLSLILLTLVAFRFTFVNQPMQSKYTEANLYSTIKGQHALEVTRSNTNTDVVPAIYKKLSTQAIDSFLIKKQLLIATTLIQKKVARADQLDNQTLLDMHSKIASLFIKFVLNNINMQKHTYSFFTEHHDLNKIETALMEQTKFGVPVSIKLAQAALETAYGTKVIHNNYFGIKKYLQNHREKAITTEYYTKSEMKKNKSKIISSKAVLKKGYTLYKCKVEDYFAKYESPWRSFRAHSLFLSTNKRYAPLFTKGKNYEAWADKIGSTKMGGVGYATSPTYGKLLKEIIKKYRLDLLDY